MPRLSSTQRVTDSVGLLWTVVLLSGLVLAGGCLILSSLLTSALRHQALDDAKVSLTQYANGVLDPRMIYGTTLRVGDSSTSIVNRDLAERPDILSVKVWHTDGTLAWTNIAPERIGKRLPVQGELAEVLRDEGGDRRVQHTERRGGFGRGSSPPGNVIEVYAPLFAGQHEVVGAYEVYANADPLSSPSPDLGHERRALRPPLGAAHASCSKRLGAASAPDRRPSRALRRPQRVLPHARGELRRGNREPERHRRGENPYTAGHSLRVQRVAVSLAQELGVPSKDVGVVRQGGLFNDIGKIAIPDLLLTKPANLTEDEFELMKRHSSEGARIISKFGRLRGCVPIIRHHHERWDGAGYPERLAGEDIPLLATIVGFAEAWDAMTIQRPYQHGLRIEEAFEEVREHRGSQFSPLVVDAFFAAVAKRPADFGVPDSEALVAG